MVALLNRPSRSDLLLAVVVTVIATGGSAGLGWHRQHLVHPIGAVLTLAGGVALAWWRVRPTAVLVWVFGLHLLYAALGYEVGPGYLPVLVALFNGILRGDRRVAYPLLAAGYLVAIGFPGPNGRPAGLAFVLGLAAWFLVLACAAEIARVAGQARRAQAARRAGEQRLRIAQDLHDVLAHQLSLITVQANAGLAMLSRDPDRAGHALHAIKDAGNTALAELREVLDVLRAPDGAAPRRPTPLLSRSADVGQLIDGAHAAGLTVHHEIRGTPRRLRGEVDRTGYRIVQEALTNAVRHTGPGTTVAVLIEYAPDALRLTVRDDGAGRAGQVGVSGGSGLPGMRERVAGLGGSLSAGPEPGGGFRVAATLPGGAP